MRNTLQWREAKWKTGRVWGWSVKGVEFPKNGFCKFILGSQGRRDEEMKKDKEPCCSVIWSLTEEKDRKSEEGKKERKNDRKKGGQKEREKYTSEKERASEAGIFIPQEVFTILSLTAFSEWQPIIFSRSRPPSIALAGLRWLVYSSL